MLNCVSIPFSFGKIVKIVRRPIDLNLWKLYLDECLKMLINFWKIKEKLGI